MSLKRFYGCGANTWLVWVSRNMLAIGMTTFLVDTIDMPPPRAGQVTVPLLHDTPLIGEPLFVNRGPLYLLLLAVPLSWLVVQRTRWGLELRACGEDPQAADVTGIDVNKRRREGVYWLGLMAGLGGACLSVAQVGVFNQNMKIGRAHV